MYGEKEIENSQESLAIIDQMIARSRKSTMNTGLEPLVWGAVITFCSVFTYLKLVYGVLGHWDAFLLLFPTLLWQLLYTRKKNKNRPVKGYESYPTVLIWILFGVLMFFLGFYTAHFQVNTVPLYILLYAFVTLFVGFLFRYKPMIIGGVLCLIAAFISIYVSFQIGLLLMAFGATVCWLIPGFLLRMRYLKGKKNHDV